MQYITGTDSTQAVLFPQSLDVLIDQSNEVRIIDLFVESIDLAQFSFHIKSSCEGRPPYHPKDLLKLYVYGYLNSLRSSRALEKECRRNIELMWLLHNLIPDHNTISNFRRDNEKAIRKVFRHTVSIAKGIKRASADVGLIFTALNLRRLMNIIDKNVFKKFLRELGFSICYPNSFTRAIFLLKAAPFSSLQFCKIKIKTAV